MKVVKMIMDALWKVQEKFISADTGAFIYDIKWKRDPSQQREDQLNSYQRGKHRKIAKEQMIRFYCNLDATNQMHLYETLLAYCGVFTRPFVRRMMKHRDIYGDPYVQYFRKTYDSKMLYLVFKMPSSKPVVLSTMLRNMFNTKYEPRELPYADDSLFSGGYPTLPIITKDGIINRDQMQILDNFGDEVWKLKAPDAMGFDIADLSLISVNWNLINLEISNDINEEVYGKDLRPCDEKGETGSSLIELLDATSYSSWMDKELAFSIGFWDQLEEPENPRMGKCKTCGIELMDEKAVNCDCSKCSIEKEEELENV